jgi:GT2 family glycosyltransferase
MDERDVTVVIPVFNAVDALRTSLEILLAGGLDPARVRLHDDGSKPERVRAFAAWAEARGFDWRPNRVNLGYTPNVNQALRQVETPFALLMNSDCFVTAGTVAGLAAVMAEHPYIGALGPYSNNAANQTIGLSAQIDWSLLGAAEIEGKIAHMERELDWSFGRRPFFVPSVNGFCTLWRMEALEAIGYLDEENFPRGYGEEDDACLRALEAGYMSAVAPHLFAVHLRTQSFSHAEKVKLKEQAARKLAEKYSERYRAKLIAYHERNPFMRQVKSRLYG